MGRLGAENSNRRRCRAYVGSRGQAVGIGCRSGIGEGIQAGVRIDLVRPVVAEVVDGSDQPLTELLLHFQVPLLHVVHPEVGLCGVQGGGREVGLHGCGSRGLDGGEGAAGGHSGQIGRVVGGGIRPQVGLLRRGYVVVGDGEAVLLRRVLGDAFEHAGSQTVVEDAVAATDDERLVQDRRVEGEADARLPLQNLQAGQNFALIEVVNRVVGLRDERCAGGGVPLCREVGDLGKAVVEALDVALMLHTQRRRHREGMSGFPVILHVNRPLVQADRMLGLEREGLGEGAEADRRVGGVSSAVDVGAERGRGDGGHNAGVEVVVVFLDVVRLGTRLEGVVPQAVGEVILQLDGSDIPARRVAADAGVDGGQAAIADAE